MKNLLPYCVAAMVLVALVASGAPTTGAGPPQSLSVSQTITGHAYIQPGACGLGNLILVEPTDHSNVWMPQLPAQVGTVCNLVVVSDWTITFNDGTPEFLEPNGTTAGTFTCSTQVNSSLGCFVSLIKTSATRWTFLSNYGEVVFP